MMLSERRRGSHRVDSMGHSTEVEAVVGKVALKVQMVAAHAEVAVVAAKETRARAAGAVKVTGSPVEATDPRVWFDCPAVLRATMQSPDMKRDRLLLWRMRRR